jgi:heat shock protein HslJ
MKTLFPLLALPLLIGCATPQPANNGLTTGKWALTAIDGAPPKSPRAGMEFLARRISATAGCNGLGGEYTVKGDRLVTGPFVSTMMYCDGLMEQERALAALFEAQPSYRIEADRLTLDGGGHRAELVRTR